MNTPLLENEIFTLLVSDNFRTFDIYSATRDTTHLLYHNQTMDIW